MAAQETRGAHAAVEVPSGARRTIRASALWPSWVILGALTLLFAGGGGGIDVPPWAEYAPFALSLVFFGLPHGAVDHLAPARLLNRNPWPRPALAVGLLYLVLGGLYLALWFVSPATAFGMFIALTWLHWGAGDLYALAAFVSGDYHPGRLRRVLTLILRGGLPMLVPLLAFPEVYRTVAESAVGLFAPGGTDALSWVFGPPFRLLAGAVFAILAVGYFASGYPGARRKGVLGAWGVDLAEVALLAAYFAFVPPVLAVGLYFCLWHSTRHVARLALLDPRGARALKAGRPGPALARFARDAAPLTVASLVLLAGLFLAVPGVVGWDPAALLAVYLVLISALTLPHVAVVSWMDLRQGLWRRDRRQTSAIGRQ